MLEGEAEKRKLGASFCLSGNKKNVAGGATAAARGQFKAARSSTHTHPCTSTCMCSSGITQLSSSAREKNLNFKFTQELEKNRLHAVAKGLDYYLNNNSSNNKGYTSKKKIRLIKQKCNSLPWIYLHIVFTAYTSTSLMSGAIELRHCFHTI